MNMNMNMDMKRNIIVARCPTIACVWKSLEETKCSLPKGNAASLLYCTLGMGSSTFYKI